TTPFLFTGVLAMRRKSVTSGEPDTRIRDTTRYAVHRIFISSPRSSTDKCRSTRGCYCLYCGRDFCSQPERRRWVDGRRHRRWLVDPFYRLEIGRAHV